MCLPCHTYGRITSFFEHCLEDHRHTEGWGNPERVSTAIATIALWQQEKRAPIGNARSENPVLQGEEVSEQRDAHNFQVHNLNQELRAITQALRNTRIVNRETEVIPQRPPCMEDEEVGKETGNDTQPEECYKDIWPCFFLKGSPRARLPRQIHEHTGENDAY